jgi:hypothetical protein
VKGKLRFDGKKKALEIGGPDEWLNREQSTPDKSGN